MMTNHQTHQGPEELLALGACFQRPDTFDDATRTLHSGYCDMEDYPSFRKIGTGEGMIYNRLGYEWHIDATDITLLHCVEAPSVGGETLFVEQTHLYDKLSPEHKLIAEHSCAMYSTKYTAGGAPAALDWNHGLRMNGTGTKLLRPSSTKKPGYAQTLHMPPQLKSTYTNHHRSGHHHHRSSHHHRHHIRPDIDYL